MGDEFMPPVPNIASYDHMGVRVSDRARSLTFYSALGFEPEPGEGDITAHAAGLINAAGVRINLIFNGEPPSDGRNILLDVPTKHPGWTHPAFTVDRLDSILEWASHHGVEITQGPVFWGRRRVCFLRDPDRNVLEFDELIGQANE
jgi:catechol 2,3-dioxygenase-like lactoylglutathione lyase family enzyme